MNSNILFRRIIFAGFILLVVCTGAKSEDDFSSLRTESLSILTRIENLTACKVKGHLSTKNYASEVSLEIRGDSFWLESTSLFGSTEIERGNYLAGLERLHRATGSVGFKNTNSFHNGKSYTYLPLSLELRIVAKPSTGLTNAVVFMVPKRWVSFTDNYEIPFVRLSALLEPNAPRVVVTSQGNLVRFEQTSDVQESQSNRGYASRWILIDKSTKCVSQYGLKGGGLGERIGSLKWRQYGQALLAPVGGTWTVNGEEQTSWHIDQIDTNLKSLRSNFVLDESKLPLGTRVTDETVRPAKTRFVGGEEIGQREHLLKITATQLIRDRRNQID